jgi:hypothetical protein
MDRQNLKFYLFLLLLVSFFLLAACSSRFGETDLAVEEDAIEQPEPTVEIMPLEDLEEWDLVWVTDSSGWGVAQVYGEMVAKDTGKTVSVGDYWEGGFAAGEMVEILRGEYQGGDYKFQKLPERIREAEIVVFYGNPRASIYEPRPGDWECVPPGPWYVNDCDPEIFTLYKEHVKEVFRLILELREGQPTIIRTYDAYNPLIDQFKEKGVYEDCVACWITLNEAYRSAAEEMGIPLAPVAELWNGPDYTIDPDSELGYTSDGIHPNQLGAAVIAQALRELGYDPIVP